MLGGGSAMALPAEAVALHLKRFLRTFGAALTGLISWCCEPTD
jgi:hypothetical protein